MAEIRPMCQADSAAVLDMMRVFYASPAVLHKASDEVLRRDIADCVGACPYLEGYVFCQGGELCGYAMLAKSYSTEYGGLCIWLEDLYLKPAHQGKGIAQAFFAFLHKKYDGSAVRYRLEVEKENAHAIAVYEHNGYRELPYSEMTREV